MVNKFKKIQLEAIKERLQSVKNMIFVDFFKVNANALSNIRKELRKNKINMFVLKTSLAKLALSQLNTPKEITENLNRQNAVIYGDDPISLARITNEFVQKKPLLKIKFAYLEGKICEKNTVEVYSKYASKNDLVGVVISKIRQPIISFIFDLRFIFYKFVSVLKEIGENKK